MPGKLQLPPSPAQRVKPAVVVVVATEHDLTMPYAGSPNTALLQSVPR